MSLSAIWTLLRTSDAVEQTLANWKISAAMLVRRTQHSDTLDITLAGAKFDDAELFSFSYAPAPIILKRSGVPWFLGVSVKTPRQGRPDAETVGYSFAGPWWYLEHTPYTQAWMFLTGVSYNQAWSYFDWTPPPATPLPGQVNITNLILNLDNNGNPVSTGGQITDALECAIAAGAPLQIGTIDCAFAVPAEAARDLSCAEVIRRTLRWHPDCVVWFDYTTTKLVGSATVSCPTIHIRRRANLAPASFSVAGCPASGLDIAARPELIPPVVVINYERLNSLNDQDQRTLTVDKFPVDVAAVQPGAMVMTINLQGERTTYLRQYLKTAPINVNDLAWWRERLPWLADSNITHLDYANNPGGSANDSANGGSVLGVIPDGGSNPDAAVDGSDLASGSTSGGTTWPRFLIEGHIPNWINGHAQMAHCALKVNYDINLGHDANGNAVIEHHANETILVKVLSTDLNSGWYNQLKGVYLGEPVPEGLAQNYFSALSQLQFEGSWEITEEECGAAGGPYLGQVLNLTEGLSAWASMRATVFESSEDLASGRTRLGFGPVAYLSPREWLTLQRVNRHREPGDRHARVNGLLTNGSHPAGGSGKHDRGGTGSKGPPEFHTWVGPATGGNPGTYDITIKPAQIDPEAAAAISSDLTVQLRAIRVCVDGEMKTMLVLGSETF